MAERVTRPEVVDDAAAVDHFDGAGADHPQVVERRTVGPDDGRPRGEVLDLEPADEAKELVGAQRVVRRLAAEEVGVLLHELILTRPAPPQGDAAGFGERETLR